MLNLQLSIQRSVHPVHRSHLFIVIAPLTIHTRSTFLTLQTKSHRWQHQFPKPSSGMPHLLCFSDSPSSPCRVASLPLSFTQECDVIPLCHFQSFFDVLAFCFLFPKPFWGSPCLFNPHVQVWNSLRAGTCSCNFSQVHVGTLFKMKFCLFRNTNCTFPCDIRALLQSLPAFSLPYVAPKICFFLGQWHSRYVLRIEMHAAWNTLE